jgi:hypothetical protein
VSNNTLSPLTVHVPDLPPLADRVAAGAAVLDRLRPGWAGQVDPDQLDMTAEHDDLLGQLYGHYAIGLEALTQADPNQQTWPSMWAVNHGFDLLAYDTGDYAELTGCWRALILARRRRGGEGR